jgi:hypothetical protein
MPPEAFEPPIPARQRPLAYAVDRAAVAVCISTTRTAEFPLQSNSEVQNAGGRNKSLGSCQEPHLESNTGAPVLLPTPLPLPSPPLFMVLPLFLKLPVSFSSNFLCTGWLKKMDSISYVYISCTIQVMWMIYITFERGGPKFSNTTARALT